MSMRPELLFCQTSCGHDFLTHLNKKVGSIGSCDECGGKDTMIINIEIIAN